MNLRDQAELDLSFTLEDAENGFGWPISVEDPEANSADLVGQSGDIGLTIDPDTGQPVTGRLAHISLRISSITASDLVGLPRGIADNKNKKPWKITFNDINGNPFTFLVQESMVDRTFGIVTCTIEFYKV